MSDLLTVWLAGLAGTSLVMVAVWAWSARIANASIVDAAWSASFSGLAAWYMTASPARGVRGWLMLAVVSAWSLRLTVHLARRIAREHPREDPRYVQLRRRWRDEAGRRFFWFFQAQAVAASALSAPILLAVVQGGVPMDAWAWTGLAAVLVGLGGEAAADRQLARYRAAPGRARGVCDVGLWAWSRHPNYFFEWVTWCGFALCAVGVPHGWIGLGAPAAMLYLLLRVTGVPAAEASSLASRGSGYRDYQRRVPSAFWPWPPQFSRRRA